MWLIMTLLLFICIDYLSLFKEIVELKLKLKLYLLPFNPPMHKRICKINVVIYFLLASKLMFSCVNQWKCFLSTSKIMAGKGEIKI